MHTQMHPYAGLLNVWGPRRLHFNTAPKKSAFLGWTLQLAQARSHSSLKRASHYSLRLFTFRLRDALEYCTRKCDITPRYQVKRWQAHAIFATRPLKSSSTKVL